MTPRDFCFWLQGYFEIEGKPTQALDAAQTRIIREHLALVFIHQAGAVTAKAPEEPKQSQEPTPQQVMSPEWLKRFEEATRAKRSPSPFSDTGVVYC